MGRPIDLNHQGLDRVICAWEVDGVIVDPGPTTDMDVLLEGLGGGPPRVLLLTHIHLDHAGAGGSLVRRFPDLQVYVHERGAPHVIDPSRLLESAGRLYGDDMEKLFGEVAPVPEANVHALSGGETVEGFRVAYTPGHASHHVCYLHEESGDAFVGDVAGVRVPPAEYTVAPTPPPDIDLTAWRESLDVVAGWDPAALCLTHFGRHEDVNAQLDRVRAAFDHWGEVARDGDPRSFEKAVQSERAEHVDAEVADRYELAVPRDQMWQGLERYWRKRPDATEQATAAEAGS